MVRLPFWIEYYIEWSDDRLVYYPFTGMDNFAQKYRKVKFRCPVSYGYGLLI